MTADVVADRLDELVRARVATAPRPPSDAEVVRALRPLAPATHDDARWRTAVLESLSRLRAGELSPSARFAIPTGEPWKRIVERIVPGLALGIAPGDARGHKRLSDRDAWAAAIVGRALGIWRDGAPPSASAVGDALVWMRLELGGKPKRTPPEIRAHFAAMELGVERAAPDRLIRQLAASRSGAARADLKALREALARRWLCGQEWDGSGPAGESLPAGDSLAELAAAVRDAAAGATNGVFGGRKVFIATVWRRLRDHRPAFASLPLDEFKRRLIGAHRAGLVKLSRADLVGAMDPAEVAASETAHLEARYHFVEREETP